MVGASFGFSPSTIKLVLVPDSSAKKFAGFGSGPLTLTGNSGTTVETLISQLNTYRSPDQQIQRVFNSDNSVYPLTTVLTQDTTVIVKDQSF